MKKVSSGYKESAQRIAKECVAVRLRLLNRVVTGLFDQELRPYKLSISQLNLLVGVAASGRVRPTDLSRRLKLEKSTLSRDLARMLEKRWVEQTPGDDGRSVLLSITEAGASLLELVVPAWSKAQDSAAKLLGAELQSALSGAVDKLWSADKNRS